MKRNISRLLKYGLLISTYALIGSVLLQVFARFFLANTPAWTEEASRLFFIYATAFASGLALKDRYYVHLDIFFEQFPKKIQHTVELIIPLLTFTLFSILTIFSIQFIVQGYAEFSPSMKIRMAFVFFSMFIMGASISYYALIEFLKLLRRKSL